MPPAAPPPSGIQRYGLNFPASFDDILIELHCFRIGRSVEKGGLGPFGHFRNVVRMLWPKLQWHEWLTDRARGLCDYPSSAWVGCAAAGKTFDAALFGLVFWLADPERTSVILTSTTGKMVRKRIWPIIRELYERESKGGLPGNMVDSKTTLQAKKGDDKHGVFAIAVREGSTSKAVANIQGLHAPRMLLIIDEATDTPEAIFEAISNLRKGCLDFRVLVIGNPISHLDPHGLCCEPVNGWNTVNVDMEEWETKGADKWEIEPGVCFHFDGLKSPNIKARELKYKFLISEADVDRARKTHNGEDTLGFWKYTRGFWAPEGVCKTILSEALIDKYNARGILMFVSRFVMIAALDPAFGGDRCVLRFAKFGDLEGGRMGIQVVEALELKIRPKAKEPIHYQIAHQVKAECEKRGVERKHFIMDESGEGGGLADIISVEWGNEIQRVEFGGSPSDMPVSEDDQRLSKEVYDRRVTELWFSIQRFVRGGQLGGLISTDCIELCSREFSDEKRKIVLDTKADCKQKIGKSPDYGDTIALLVELGRRLGASAGSSSSSHSSKKWLDEARKMSEVYVSEEEGAQTQQIYSPHYSFDS